VSRGLPWRISLSRGTQRKQFVDTLPLLIQAWLFRNSRGRQRSGAAFFSGNFGIISVLAVIILGGFRSSRSRIRLNWPLLWKWRTRNQKLVALQKNQSQSISKQTTKYKKTKSKEVDIDKLQSTNLG
jgi:hypothetical protein